MWEWLDEWKTVLGWLAGVSLASLVLTVLLMPIVVVRLPPDYLVAAAPKRPSPPTLRQMAWTVGKNIVGGIFVLAGIAMLVLPGQGVLTIVIGLLLMDFPGKRKIERQFLSSSRVLGFINRMRVRRGRPPLEKPPTAAPDQPRQ